MLLPGARWVLMGFLHFVSGAFEPQRSICALKGSSVSLACSAPRLGNLEPATSAQRPRTFEERVTPFGMSLIQSRAWYRLYANGSVERELAVEGIAKTEDFDLSIRNISEGDVGAYCCSSKQRSPLDECGGTATMLRLADLQVQVLPEREHLKVSLICKSSCPLSEAPEAYIWYQNGDFLYEDWSPWYQQLVSSDQTVRYSCAIKGSERFRAPDVSVDSITKDCFSVSYAGGRRCSSGQTSEDRPCTITYPTEVNATAVASTDGSAVLTCSHRCPAADDRFQMYVGGDAVQDCSGREMIISDGHGSHDGSAFSCSMRDDKDLHSQEICAAQRPCSKVNYPRHRICAMEGSTVQIGMDYLLSYPLVVGGFRILYKTFGGAHGVVEPPVEWPLPKAVRLHEIKDVMKNNSGEYKLVNYRYQENVNTPGVSLVVTGMELKFSPSDMVVENQRVTLICSTSCPVPGAHYFWFFNNELLTMDAGSNKFLVLDPVGLQHAGNYSCLMHDDNREFESKGTLMVQGLDKMVMMLNVAKLLFLSVVPPALCIFHLWIRTAPRTTTEPPQPSHKASAAEQEEECDESQL